jgi:predicted amidohydrolase
LSKVRTAMLQFAPVYDDIEASLTVIEERIAGAAAGGAQLIVIGETWLPGYPMWIDHSPSASLWNHEATKTAYARLRRNSVVVGDSSTERLSAAARAANAVLVAGIHERIDAGAGSGTLYNTVLTFDADGSLVNHHRKLVPTYTERLLWGPGDATGLKAAETAVGRVGALICWEHWMPLSRQALHDSGESIHIALWPTVHARHQLASQHYAFEGRCFVLAAGSIGRVRDMPAELDRRPEHQGSPDQLLLRGGSCAYGPTGECLVEPYFDDEDTIFVDLHLDAIDRETMTLDVSGHFARPDIFDLKIRRERP